MKLKHFGAIGDDGEIIAEPVHAHSQNRLQELGRTTNIATQNVDPEPSQ